MASSAESSRYVPPHRRQQQQNGHHTGLSTPQTTRRFDLRQPLPPRTPNTANRRRPRDSASSSTWSSPTTTAVRSPGSSGLSASSPGWTPPNNSSSCTTIQGQSQHQMQIKIQIQDHHGDTTTSRRNRRHSQAAIQAESMFTRIVCISLMRRQDRWKTFQKRMRHCLNNYHHEKEQEHHPFAAKVERFAAVDGQDVMHLYEDDVGHDADELSLVPLLPLLEWDATQNAQYDKYIQPPMIKQLTAGEVGCAMSHIQLWKELAEMGKIISSTTPTEEEFETTTSGGENCNTAEATMLILEDDAILYQEQRGSDRHRSCKGKGRRQSYQPASHNHYNKNGRGRRHSDSFALGWRNTTSRSTSLLDDESSTSLSSSLSSTTLDEESKGGGFVQALLDVEKILPKDWDILYLGFSDRGERKYIVKDGGAADAKKATILPVTLFRPTYGFHTHAYALNQKAASVLLDNLPVKGPLDVWLADNQWFGLSVYCANIDDGSSFHGKTGAQLISQQRHDTRSDIRQSGRVSM